ncbi:thiamine pyrophosphate-dependent dehydrogenase E1 component subunit alpha [Novosphingobium mangrovi (ex Hu et al. 2023)]|uniref:Thiamine pyrophosphate-dependent dehydrogenase E1 component subunit alpha n=1 Tax=Novosphingobium mangrovi (ex Hu et al. 2023) TaxID=2930094 RepID=A0ABT0AEJ2_9SPHN|nr:thiamine pyrophosphate-dependent dehydrogenase E1 component subunit alpha [Novosphingobium mangrovi (ex Hu et al. 2023)]MCJ1961622.1 thiamine pyrophosphate-dependent dehydrogenase E1 component subunit alpha [Novosphingobium mangrovi (ex Hu et al. 2023)]
MTQPSNAPQPDSAALTDIFRRMLRIERNDNAILSTIRKGRLQMPYYSARGQEVIPATISHFLTDEDQICTIYRGIQDMVAKDMPLKPLWAEIAGRVDGTCKGKGGPMHLTHPPTGVMVTTGVVGSSMPIANGLAWAAKLDGSRRVVIAYFGDGASNIGAFHESLNLASLWKLPVIFVCPNNGFAEHTRFENGTSVDQISKRAIGYGMPGFTVDGNDPWEMYAQVSTAIARARDGEGPTLLECTTFRFLGHVLGDDNKYMNEGELAAAKEKDPLPLFRQRLLDEGHVDEATLAAMQEKIEAEVAEARDFGLASELPPVDEIRRDVFAQEMMA